MNSKPQQTGKRVRDNQSCNSPIKLLLRIEAVGFPTFGLRGLVFIGVRSS